MSSALLFAVAEIYLNLECQRNQEACKFRATTGDKHHQAAPTGVALHIEEGEVNGGKVQVTYSGRMG